MAQVYNICHTNTTCAKQRFFKNFLILQCMCAIMFVLLTLWPYDCSHRHQHNIHNAVKYTKAQPLLWHCNVKTQRANSTWSMRTTMGIFESSQIWGLTGWDLLYTIKKTLKSEILFLKINIHSNMSLLHFFSPAKCESWCFFILTSNGYFEDKWKIISKWLELLKKVLC